MQEIRCWEIAYSFAPNELQTAALEPRQMLIN